MAASVKHNEELRRFEVEAGGALAHADYTQSDGKVVFTHTEVPEACEGQGIGGALARAALDWARSSNLQVIARCPFIAGYIKRHPEYADLVRS